jgi:hypothetical protein
MDYAANLALFLQEKTGSIYGQVSVKMPAKEQRALFGRYLGKGQIVIDGSTETVLNRVKVAFGMDWDDRNVVSWKNL